MIAHDCNFYEFCSQNSFTFFVRSVFQIVLYEVQTSLLLFSLWRATFSLKFDISCRYFSRLNASKDFHFALNFLFLRNLRFLLNLLNQTDVVFYDLAAGNFGLRIQGKVFCPLKKLIFFQKKNIRESEIFPFV